MTHEPGHGDFEHGEGIPPTLAEDLSSLYRAGAEPPQRVDDAVLAAARERFAAMDVRGDRPGGFFVVVRRIGLVGGPLAAAAVLALIVWMTPWRPGVPQGPTPMPGMASRQAKGLLEKEVDKKMADDRLAFQDAAGEERALGLADADKLEAGSSEGVATLADTAGRRDENELAAKSRSVAGAPPAGPVPQAMLAAEAAPQWLEDFNGDGVVDMRDALMMARAVERGEWTMGAKWDLNGDGVVDEKDVQVVALAAVDLERHGEVLR